MTWRAALLLGAGALTLPVWPAPFLGVVAMTGVVLLLVALDWALAAPLHALTATRTGDRIVRLGGTATVTLHLANASGRTLRAQVRDAWVPSAGARPDVPSARVLRVEPGGTATLPVRLTPARRGDRPAVALTVRSFGPLRLAFRQRSGRPDTPPWTLRVLPRFDSRRHLSEKLARLRIIDGVQVTRGRGQGTEFDTLREYVIGDDVRSIDWRASARRSDVLVRTWRPERDRRLVCVLDTGRTSAVRVGDEPRLDTAIDAALLLTALPADHAAAAETLYRHGDAAEKRAVLRALPMLPIGAACVPLLHDAIRTNDTRLIAAALGPYARHLEQPAWRQAVLKCVFTGVPLAVVDDLDGRADGELAAMLAALAAERHAAGRTMPADATDLLHRLGAGAELTTTREA
ncbi:EboA domain-containing protein [Micromonospora globispora]|uniref:EboA domain-containing protein n=1 Tax=Micromonospora globispora TaxID=1450148 RepID=UPI001FAF29F9|nr:EboA domain-containing protein [Micromonospora globispora]